MKRTLVFITGIIFSFQAFSQGNAGIDINTLNHYKQLNDKELRLIEFSDNDEALILKLSQLEVINASRNRYKAPPVSLDILASRVANKQCREAAENKYLSHWNLAGEKPYMRYAFAGGFDHVSENAFGGWTGGIYDKGPETIASMMEQGHNGFMSERAPNDGHKQNIIEKSHNYVGLGYYITDKEFRYYEEFIDRYVKFISVPGELKVNERSTLTVDTEGNSFLYFITIYYEDFPKPMKQTQLTKTGSYPDFTPEIYKNIPAWDLASYCRGTTYSIPLSFTKKGLYYIHIFTDPADKSKSRSLNTKGKTPVSGIVIKVR